MATRHKLRIADEPPLVECSFLIPEEQDSEIASGESHSVTAWCWLDKELFRRFDGRTLAPGVYDGLWKSFKTGRPVHDQTRRYIVAVPEARVEDVRQLLREACRKFKQQCIYLSVAGHVEFVRRNP